MPGSPGEIEAELERLGGILSRLTALDAQPPPQRSVVGGDYMYDMLLELQRRRRAALKFEMDRLQRCDGGCDDVQDLPSIIKPSRV